ncbi:MAG: siderophore-interacting protein, partial [Propionibacteriaceae bacterium]
MAEAARKIMHEFKARALEVSRVEELTASMRRIFLRGDLDDFPVQQFAPTQHVRLMLPEADGELLLPTMVAGRPRVEGDRRPITRDYTVRGYRDGELIIDIATGHNGPASRWAQTAVPGSRLGVCGPRGSLIMPTYDSYVLVADEAA